MKKKTKQKLLFNIAECTTIIVSMVYFTIKNW